MTVPNAAGRVREREYVAGWLKRGPTGVIGTNKSDAAETVRTLLADLADRSGPDGPAGGARPAPASVDALLAERGVHPVTYAEWQAIEAAEAELARTLGRGERVKLVGLEAMLRACRP
jgi:ferredoxin--NADP+ reductase